MKTKLLTLFLVAFSMLVYHEGARAQCGDSIDLGTWVKEGNPAYGNWVVTNGGNTVNQTINGEPTFYVSPDSFINVIVTGNIQVNTTGDDDWIGFVFGYNGPDTTDPNNFDFYLFDWKQANQNFAGFFGNEGMALTRINGPVTNVPEAFSAKAGPYATLLASQYGANEGWNDLQTYAFALTYTNTRTVIAIDGDTIFDIYGCFEPGRFGFYNYSQSAVNYSDFSYRVAAAFEVLTPDVCLGDTAKFIALSDSCFNAAGIPVNNTLVSWFWTFGDGNTSNDTNASHYYNLPGTYNVSLEVTDYLGCKDTAYSTVDVIDVHTGLGNDTAICTGDNLVLDADTFATSYLWSTGATSQTISVSNPGTYFVTVSGNGGCSDTDTLVLTNIALPVVDLGNDTSICNNDTLVLHAGNPGASFLWSNGSTLDSIAVNDSGAYHVEVTNDSGCSNIDTVIITNYAQPVVTPPNPELCYGDTITVSASGANTYTWFPAAGISATTGQSIEIFTLVDTSYYVVGIDSNSCLDTSVFNVDVHELPTFNITGDTSLCTGEIASLTFELTGLGPWDLSYALLPDTFVMTGIASNTFTITTPDSGEYIPLTVQDSRCSNTGGTSAMVQHHPLPNLLTIPSTEEICIGDTLLLSISGAQDYSWFPAYNINDTTGDSVLVFPSVDTSYMVLATDSNGCQNFDTAEIIVHPLPIITVNDTTICSTDTIIATASGADTYSWFPAIGLGSVSGASVEVFTLSDTTYTITGTDSNGCVNTTTMSIDVWELPTSDFSGGDSVCTGDSVVLNLALTGVGPWNVAYTVQQDTFVINGIAQNNLSIAVLDSGTYAPLWVNDARCSSTGGTSSLVFHHPLPTLVLNPANVEICIGDTQPINVSGAQTYQWSPNYNIDTTIGSNVLVNPTTDTLYVVTGTDENGCVSQDTASIVVHPLPEIALAMSGDSVCKLDTTTITASGAISYQWAVSPGLSAYNQAVVDAYPTVSTNYVVTGTDANGCKNTNDTTVVVLALPDIVVLPGTGAICIGESETMTAPSYYTYTWLPTNVLVQDGNNNDTVVATPLDTTIFTITAIDSLGCTSDTNYQLAVTPLPVLTISADDSVICPGIPTELHVSGAISYAWSPTNATTGSNTSSPDVFPSVTTTYTVTATGPGGCQDTGSITVAVYTIGPFSAGNNQSICRNDTAQFSASGGVAYQWSPNIGLSDINVADPLCFSQASRYYTVSITDSNGCVSTDNLLLTVNPLPFARAGEEDTLCKGESTRIGGMPTGPEGSSYQWSPAAGLLNHQAPNPYASPDTSTTYTVLVTDSNGCMRQSSVRITVNEHPVLEILEAPEYLCQGDTTRIELTPGLSMYTWVPETKVMDPDNHASLIWPRKSITYTITGTDENACITTIEVEVPVKPRPFVNIIGNYDMCVGDTIAVEANAAPGILQWLPEDVFSTPTYLTTDAFPSEPTYIQLKNTDGFGCSNYDTSLVFVHPLPRVDAGEDIENCNMQTVYLGGPSTTGPENEILWSPAEKLNNATIPNPRILSIDIDTFYLRVQSPEGCVNHDTIIVNSDCYLSFYAPNSFSPDGDGVNDEFKIAARNIYNIHLQIYDRWGHLLFETRDLEMGWNGTFPKNGGQVPIGSYFWQMTFESESGRDLSEKGVVNVLR